MILELFDESNIMPCTDQKKLFFLLVSCIQPVTISFSRLFHYRLSRENIRPQPVCPTHFLLQYPCKLSLSLSNSLNNAHKKC